ncbi:MAG: serine hydrolase [Longimicrobiales bacterium]
MRRRNSGLLLLPLLTGCTGSAAPPTQRPVPAAAPVAVVDTARLAERIRERVASTPGETGVYLIDLERDSRVAVNADVSMHAASTMKVPVLLELFRQAAEGRIALDSGIVAIDEFTSIADSSRYRLTAESDSESALYRLMGQRVPARELARRMIVRSSNLATNILIEQVGAANVRRTVDALGAPAMVVHRGVEDIPAYQRGLNNTTTAQAFGRVLEVIARCERGDVAPPLRPLTANDCREITSILAAQEFQEKIPAGVPPGIRVANKTGWITEIDHDGGIVYPPARAPYVLVVLTRGIADRAAAIAVARDVSRIVWEELVESTLPASVAPAAARKLASLHERYRVDGLAEREFTHAELWALLGPIVDGSSLLARDRIGTSGEGRELWAVRHGTGDTRVLLWSQMHGDESTATMALLDLFNFLATSPEHPLAGRLRDRLTIVAVPMLNPDGAERFERRNAQGIDINRDARAQATPEGRALKLLRDSLQPEFGFNLHDQNVRTRVGDAERTVAIALLAPPWSVTRDIDPVRERARRVAATLRLLVEPLVPARVAKYDESFNPRAFGDLMQQWGTSTVLIESGGYPDDPEKQYLRRVNFAALLGVLDAIGSGAYAAVDPAWYESLPLNGRSASDLLVRGGTVVVPGLEPFRADLAVDYANPLERSGARVSDVGDLAEAVARDTLDIEGLYVFAESQVRTGELIGRSDLIVTAQPHPDSVALWRIVGSPERVEPATIEHAAVGCHVLELGSWAPSFAEARPGDTETMHVVPDTVRLFDRAGTHAAEAPNPLLRPRNSKESVPFRHAYWRPVAADSITLVWSTGFVGTAVELKREGDVWRGRANSFTDVMDGRPRPSAPATLRRIACSAARF